MSIEIRHNARNQFECDWGEFSNAEADPQRPMGLILIEPDYVRKLLGGGPRPAPLGGTHSAQRDDAGLHACYEYNGTCWRWRLHDAHWWDGANVPMMVGKLEIINERHAIFGGGVTIRQVDL